MKRILLFSLLAINLFMATVHAQSPVKPDLGIKLGANFAHLGGDHWEQSYQPGVLAGAIVGVRKHKVGLQVEFLINTAHYTTKDLVDSVRKGDFRATYFDIPVMLEYRLIGAKLAPKVWIMAGPQFSNLMSVKSLNAYANDVKQSFKSGTVSAVVGLEVRYAKFTLGGRYVIGLTSINNEDVSTVKQSWSSRSGQVYLGFRFI
ncbi:hypothetical protein CJD36_000140 [Flavipsychrobacter stenotrophus]|uniref:Outer membrane protein beta-barrel domain-containing protein n=1 Tax=Flavipsychrobacter stenotrophus TaxID=2077091 RepID=A0A2S7T050_9BACT|nr:porin family protein [Flavipsychrobacter stenotrophus]PQJ12205.1 hypothetical protein CJD36_000140 [Flavipsychrobacter stenotrophus]